VIRIKNRNPNSWPPGAYGNWYPSPWKLISWYLNNVPRAFNLPNTVNLYSSLLSSYPKSQHKKPVVFRAVTESLTRILYYTGTCFFAYPPLLFPSSKLKKNPMRTKPAGTAAPGPRPGTGCFLQTVPDAPSWLSPRFARPPCVHLTGH